MSEILSEKEKNYLGNIIKPFKEKVDYISKRLWRWGNCEWITIKIVSNSDDDISSLLRKG